jgi:hypothetical protein
MASPSLGKPVSAIRYLERINAQTSSRVKHIEQSVMLESMMCRPCNQVLKRQLKNNILYDISKVLKLNFIYQRMFAISITLTRGSQNEFIEYQKAKVRIAVLPIIDVKTLWNSPWELLEQAYLLQEFTPEWLHNPTYTESQPLYSTDNEWTIVKYVMEV